MKVAYIVGGIILAIVLIAWIGLKIKPSPFEPFGKPAAAPQTMPLPAGLPAPVERLYRQTYGDAIPVINTAVLTGRGSMAPAGFSIPIRFRFIYEVGKDYRALIDGTFFNLPVMKVSETYIDGHGLGKMPYGIDEGPWYDDSMNLRVWCEILNWFPAALLNDPRVEWKPVDEDTALLVVPFGDKTQTIVVRFDPETGAVKHFEAMKYRDANHKVLWINAIWFDQGKAWVYLNVEESLFNVDVHDAIVSN